MHICCYSVRAYQDETTTVLKGLTGYSHTVFPVSTNLVLTPDFPLRWKQVSKSLFLSCNQLSINCLLHAIAVN